MSITEVEDIDITNFKRAIKESWVDENGNSQLDGKEKYIRYPKDSDIFIIIDSAGKRFKYLKTIDKDNNIFFEYLNQ